MQPIAIRWFNHVSISRLNNFTGYVRSKRLILDFKMLKDSIRSNEIQRKYSNEFASDIIRCTQSTVVFPSIEPQTTHTERGRRFERNFTRQIRHRRTWQKVQRAFQPALATHTHTCSHVVRELLSSFRYMIRSHRKRHNYRFTFFMDIFEFIWFTFRYTISVPAWFVKCRPPTISP